MRNSLPGTPFSERDQAMQWKSWGMSGGLNVALVSGRAPLRSLRNPQPAENAQLGKRLRQRARPPPWHPFSGIAIRSRCVNWGVCTKRSPFAAGYPKPSSRSSPAATGTNGLMGSLNRRSAENGVPGRISSARRSGPSRAARTKSERPAGELCGH